MAAKWKIEELKIGAIMETTFLANPVEDSKFGYRATHLGAKRAPKVVLCDDHRIRPGVPTSVKVIKIEKPERADRGYIEVEFVRADALKLEGVYLDPVVAKKLQILLESGLNILLDGPQGCGKTVLTRTIAQQLGMEFVFFNCAAVIEATDFLATIQVRASETGAPITDFVETDFLRALGAAAENKRKRYLVFLDEFNRCQESARNSLMPALDSTRRVFNPITNAFLPVPDNVQFIAAVNRGGEFSATFGIDAAQLDRFAPLQMDYLPAEEEVALLERRHPQVSKTMLRLIVKIANRVRKNQDLAAGLSVRATEEVCVYLSHPLMEGADRSQLAEILQSSFCGRFGGRWNDSSTDAGIVWRLITDAVEERKKSAKS